MPVNEPALAEPMAYVARGAAADVERAVAAARAAFDHGPWPHTAPHERARILHKIAGTRWRSAAPSSPRSSRATWACPSAKPCLMCLAIEHPQGLPSCSPPALRAAALDRRSLGQLNFVWREPIGVCGADRALELPAADGRLHRAGPGRRQHRGLKPASYRPPTALMLAETIHDTGLPLRGVLNLLTGPGAEVGEVLARHPGVDKLAFTGSTEVGRRIMELGSATVKRVTLELGGKSPSLVLPDADLSLAVDGVLFGVFS